ncbi:MAG: hypothetical protein ABSA51_03930 [Anaerolineaceae bacterium]
MSYPLSSDVSPSQPTAAAQYNALRADALRLGQAEADGVKLGQFLSRFARGVKLVYLATNRLRIPCVTTDPPTLMINGCMCQAAANVDLPAGLFSGGAATWYVFAQRTAGSTTFTLVVNTAASEGADQRIIGEADWDGTNISAVRDYFTTALGAPDYNSGWFAATTSTVYTKAHGLSQYPRLVIVEHSTSATGASELIPILVNSDGSIIKGAWGYDATNIYFNSQGSGTSGVLSNWRRQSGSGYVRIMAWK